jgi:hypothetical protein
MVQVIAAVGVQPHQSWAIPTDPNDPSACAGKITASLSASSANVFLGNTTNLSWNVQWQPGCGPTWMRLYYRDATTGVLMDTDVTGSAIGSSGTAVDRPQSSGSYFVQAYVNGWPMDFGSETVNVGLPVVNGRTVVDITHTNQNGLFAQAIRVPGASVRIAGGLELDLSHMQNLFVAPGVQILGDRTAVRAGPRLFTTSFPPLLLKVGSDTSGSDHVRISGIRLDGGESDDPFSAVGKDDSDGIGVFSSQDIEIDHSEIHHWRGSAINVHDGNNANDPAFVGRINRDNADTVRVHDNYIHHNQHPSSNYCGSKLIDGGGHAAGYGVVASDGAYATIENNVFDWNRHSIAGDGKTGTGYIARRNLILANGGVHFRCLDESSIIGTAVRLVMDPFSAITYIAWEVLDGASIYHTHAIDMHAIHDCNVGDHNCGPAGEFMDIEFNTVLYTAGNAIHLRGSPAIGMDVKHNVFAHKNHDGGTISTGALLQNETGLHDSDNEFGVNTFNDRKSCDFDGDGIGDPFIATGATFWYSSSVLGGRWVFLGQSPARLDEVTFGDFDGDGRCDVSARGQVFLNPDPLPFARSPGGVSTVIGKPALLNLVATGGARPYSWTVTGLPLGLSANSAGQITGTPVPGAAANNLVTATVTDANHQIGGVAFSWSVTATVPALLGERLTAVGGLVTNAGLTLGRVSYSNSCVDPGTVITQSPAGGRTAEIGSPVDVTVSRCDSGNGGGGHMHPA